MKGTPPGTGPESQGQLVFQSKEVFHVRVKIPEPPDPETDGVSQEHYVAIAGSEEAAVAIVRSELDAMGIAGRHSATYSVRKAAVRRRAPDDCVKAGADQLYRI